MTRVLLLLLSLLVGCADSGAGRPADEAARPRTGTGTPAPVLTVEQALQVPAAGPVLVRGYVLVARDGSAQLCTGLAGSYPPQCGRPALALSRLNPAALPATDSTDGVLWTGETTLRGTLRGAVLDVSPELR